MKAMTTGEKIALIRYHAQSLAQFGMVGRNPTKSEVLDSVARIAALIKSVPKYEFGVED